MIRFGIVSVTQGKGSRSHPIQSISTGSSTPTPISFTTNAAGSTLAVVFSSAVSFGAGGNSGLTITPSGGTSTVSYTSGAGSTTLLFSLSRALNQGETFNTLYTNPGNGIEAVSNGADVVSFNIPGTNNSTLNSSTPILTSLSSYGQDVGSGSITLTVAGTNFTSGDQIVLWNTPITTTFNSSASLSATISSSTFSTPNFGTVVVKRNSTTQTYALPFEATPVNTATNNFVVGLTSAIQPSYAPGTAGTHPSKLTVIVQPTTGFGVRRISSVTDTAPAANSVGNLRIVYAKWSSINATGEYILCEAQDSTNSYLYRIADGVCLGKVTGTTAFGSSVGENSEMRWSTRGYN
jgi:hypothetical protein